MKRSNSSDFFEVADPPPIGFVPLVPLIAPAVELGITTMGRLIVTAYGAELLRQTMTQPQPLRSRLSPRTAVLVQDGENDNKRVLKVKSAVNAVRQTINDPAFIGLIEALIASAIVGGAGINIIYQDIAEMFAIRFRQATLQQSNPFAPETGRKWVRQR